MRKNKLGFKVLSSRKCGFSSCDKFLKQRLVNEKPTVNLCYEHHKKGQADMGHTIDCQPRKKRVLAGMPVKNYR